MQIEKLSKELKAIRKLKQDEYGPFNKKMQAIADIWSVLIGKRIRPHQVALMYAAAKIVRANNEYKYDSYIDAINYLVQADEIHREDVSELVDSYFPKDGCLYMSSNWIWNFAATIQTVAEHFYKIYLDELEKQKSK